MISARRLLAIALLATAPAFVPVAQAANLNIPQSHPRIWYSTVPGSPGAARLARARTYNASNPAPSTNWEDAQRYRLMALRALLQNNNTAGCDPSIKAWLATYNFPSRNDSNWSGEKAIVAFDWCYESMTATERTNITNRWNARLTELNNDAWGGVTMAANNYFWGYLRNGLLWGIASYHHNSQAQSFIDHALDVRYRSLTNPNLSGGNRFQKWYEAYGVGGTLLEGTQYGAVMVDYPVMAFTTASDFGYDAWNATPFWKEAVFYLHYNAMPTTTLHHDGTAAKYEIFPYNDDENFVNGDSAIKEDYGNFLGMMQLRYPNSPVGRLAKNWVDTRKVPMPWWVKAELATTTVTSTMPSLPADYYAAGAEFFYGSGPNSRFMLQLGAAESNEAGGGVGHHHLDLGNFQIWRKGRWLTRETTGYARNITGWNNSGTVDARASVAHNTVLFEGKGQIDSRLDWSKVTRLQSARGFSYAAVDMTNSYRANAQYSWDAKYDWPFAERAVREFIYLRDLETLVILDRVRSGSDSLQSVYNEYTGPKMQGTAVRKTFVLHATGTGTSANVNPFTVSTAQATATVGTQRMDLRTLVPANPTYRIINEGSEVGQFRLEFDTSGAEQSYFLNVVSTRDASEQAVTASVVDQGTAWQITLNHPQKGSSVIVLQKGETSTGGTIRLNGGATEALSTTVQGMIVQDTGPLWAGATSTPGYLTGGNGQVLPGTSASGATTASAKPIASAASATPATTARTPSSRIASLARTVTLHAKTRWLIARTLWKRYVQGDAAPVR